MRKIVMGMVAFMITITALGQKDKQLTLNEETNLIEAVYYHENGEISQKGTFNLDRKLHGEWISYNEEGVKVSQGSYEKGLRTGTWSFWSDNTMKKVEYNNNAVASINGVKSETRLADNH